MQNLPAPPAPLRRAKTWLVAARPHTLSASLVPVVVGSALALRAGEFLWGLFGLTLLGSLLVQVGANLTDEQADHGATASAHKFPAPHKVIARGLLSRGAVRVGAAVAFGVATLIGAFLVWRTGWPLLAACLASLAVAYGYSAGPFPLGDYALGEVLVFFVMGPLMVGATFYVQTGWVGWEALWFSLPVAGLVAAILVANNLRDEEEDLRNGRRTLVTVFGGGIVRLGYQALVLLAFLTPAAALPAGRGGPWLFLPWLTLPLALRVSLMILRGRDRETLHRALKGTSALHLAFGLLWAAALVAESRWGG